MYRSRSGLIFLLLVAFAGVLLNLAEAKFPDDPKPCKYGDGDCIGKIIDYLLHEKADGDSSLNLVKLDPLRVNKISIHQGEDNPVNIDLEFTKNDVIGFRDSNVVKVKGFGEDLKQKHEVHLKVKKVSLVGDYKIKGKVLILPINGNGKSNMTMINTDLVLLFTGVPYEQDGATYMKVEKLKIKLEPERLYYYFGNLFNGDKALGDNMNLFLNENWHDIYKEVRDSLVEAFAQIFESIINNVFSKYPYEKFFEA